MNRFLRNTGRILVLPIHLLTGVGGFWLSRAWRNASLFAGLWLILAALQRAFDALCREWLRGDNSILEIPSSYIHLKALYLAAVLGLAALSLACLAGRRALPGPARLANPLVSVALGLAAMAATYGEARDASTDVAMYLRQGGIDVFREPDDPARPRIYRDVRFADSAMWGNPVFLPYGRDCSIKGRILYEGKPVRARVKAYLNDHYRTPVAQSDAEGYFALAAPRGEWKINRISVVLQPDPPVEDGLVLTVLDADRKAPPFDNDFFGQIAYRGRLAVKSATAPEREELTLVLRRHVDVTWPVRGRQKQPADRETASIRWQPVDGTAEYRVTVFEQTHGPDGLASARAILQRTAVRPELPLKTLPTGNPPAAADYYVEVEAFSKDGELLTLSKSAFDETTFVIAGGVSLAREMVPSGKCSE